MNVRYMLMSGLLVVAFLISSCGLSMREKNINNLKLLRKGMTKMEVIAIMGDPLKDEVYHQDDVWFYFTESKWSDGSMTRDECTPVFFEEDALTGWGHKEYKKFRQRNW